VPLRTESGHRRHQQRAGCRALMGPRPSERGYPVAPTVYCSQTSSLQWGRALTITEIPRLDRLPLTRRPASMGPRSFERANIVPDPNDIFFRNHLQWGRSLPARKSACDSTPHIRS